jgi:hypothetical protein
LWPVELSIYFHDREVVDTSITVVHQSVLVKLPILIAIRAKPVAGIVAPIIRKTNRDSWPVQSPQFLYETIIKFLVPFAGQERYDLPTFR